MPANDTRLGLGRYIQAIFNCGDIAIVNAVFATTLSLYPQITENHQTLRMLWLLVNICIMPLLIADFRHRHGRRAILMDHVIRKAVGIVGVHALFFLSIVAFLRIWIIPLHAYIFFYFTLLITLCVWHVSTRYFLKAMRRRGYNITRVVIVGTGPTAQRLFAAMQNDAGFGYKVCGFFDDECPDHFPGKYIGGISLLDSFVREKNVQQIFFTLSGQHEDFLRVVKVSDDTLAEFYYVPQISRYVSRRFELNSIGSMPLLSITRNPLKNPLNRIFKRFFGIVVSSVFLVFYPLIYIPVAIAIKLSSPGPVYFKQERTGYRGRSFMCLKFRTMRINAKSDEAQATRNDPRKTRFGDFLRRTSLDELPQFINVWKGDMSVVGPRPHMLKHTEEYTALVDRYMARHAVKPGITGWAQVNGYRGLTDELWKMERRVEHDVWYIENWTFLLDLKIMVRTVLNAIQGEKNAF